MNRFTADYSDFSSSTAATPVFQAKNRQYQRTETPDLASTTPLAPPPSRPFGSSQVGSGVSKLRFTQNARDLPSQRQPNTFGLSNVSHESYDDEGEQDYTQDMMDDDEEYTQYTNNQGLGRSAFEPQQSQALMSFSTQDPAQSLSRSSRRLSRQSTNYSALPRPGSDGNVPSLARNLRRGLHPARLENDPDVTIVQTEELLRSISEEAQSIDDDVLDIVLADSAKELEKIWEGSATERKRRKDEALEIGPGPGAPSFEKARYVAILILRLYNSARITQDEDGAMSMPQILLDWLNEYHQTLESAFSLVKDCRPNPTASDFFWDVIEGLIARGQLDVAMRLLGDADFSYARVDDGTLVQNANYNGPQLQAIQTAVFHLRRTLNASPSVQSRDWRLNGADWIAFRQDVESELETLDEMTGTHEDHMLHEAEAEDGFGQPGKALPYDIFLRLRTIYRVLLGSSGDLISISNDWLEASILLTVWWNPSMNSKVQQWSFDVSRAQHPEQDTDTLWHSYLGRLKESFLAVTDPSYKDTYKLNPQSFNDLTLGLVLQGEPRLALALLQTQSLCIASALAEVGSWSGWLSSSVVPDGLDEDDLMVLANGEGDTSVTKDDILEHYSQQLFDRAELDTSQDAVVEGWEIAISVISRCDNRSLASSTVQDYVDQLTVTTSDRAQRLVTLCGELGLGKESRRVSEQYGDHLVNSTNDYGTALLCYARSHAESKVRQLVDLLNSYCLVQSKAYPVETEMDTALSRLVSNPKQALSGIAEADPQAVEVLQFYLVGYACLRRYYTTRDDTRSSSSTTQKKTAAKALVAAINSAADSIYGGLYDPTRQSAIQVDGLLTLLGEATALTAENNSGQRVFNSEQLYAVLAAIEDLQTVSDRVYAATEDCLNASLRQSHGSLPPSPHAMLKKSMSSGTNSNFSFSMMGSEMLTQSSESVGAKSLGSTVWVGGQNNKTATGDDVERGWDWRANFKGQDTRGEDVLSYLRKNIAMELSIASLEEGL